MKDVKEEKKKAESTQLEAIENRDQELGSLAYAAANYSVRRMKNFLGI